MAVLLFVTQEWDPSTGSWKIIARGPRFRPGGDPAVAAMLSREGQETDQARRIIADERKRFFEANPGAGEPEWRNHANSLTGQGSFDIQGETETKRAWRRTFSDAARPIKGQRDDEAERMARMRTGSERYVPPAQRQPQNLPRRGDGKVDAGKLKSGTVYVGPNGRKALFRGGDTWEEVQ